MDDFISRQAAIGIFTQLWDCIGTIMDRDEWEDVCRTTANELPSAQRKGKWIEEWEMGWSECPFCGESYLWEDFKGVGEWNFCPNCGAKMTKGEEDVRKSD